MENAESSTVPQAVRSLRDAFGDPKPPDISRKITACVACRKQKIKCHMTGSQPPCLRCKKKGLSCTVNRSLQMLLESDVTWKQTMEQKMQKMEEALANLVRDGASQQRHLQHSENENSESADDTLDEGNSQGHNTTDQEEGRWKIVIDLESNPGALPGQSLDPTPCTRPKPNQDFISRGVISKTNAQKYLHEYQNRLDHFIYNILGDHTTATLDHLRKACPLLATATCAVGALHLASPDFDPLYKEFIAQVAIFALSKRSTIDDVRALCIGAFWLNELSSSLIGTAVRLAADLQLHRSFPNALEGDRGHYVGTRLYFLVYACDHHISVPFGRPPMTRECEAIRDARKLLNCEHATENDARLVSQVLRWSVCSNVYDTFGADVDRPLAESQVSHIRRFSIALDSLRAEWADRFKPNTHVGNYPRKGVGVQYHFAKLYLCSHALRGAGSDMAKSRPFDVALEVDEIANSAVISATSILRAVVSDTEIQSYLNGLPAYFHVMIAFATVFLLKVSTRFSASVQLDTREARRLMLNLVAILKGVTETMHPHHVLVSITKGIEELLHSSGLISGSVEVERAMTTPQQWQQQEEDVSGPLVSDADMRCGSDFDLMGDGMFDPFSINEFDLLLGQDA